VLWSSCIRDPVFRTELERNLALADTRDKPMENDLVLVCVQAPAGAYSTLEDPDGVDVPLKAGDEFIGVLGTRRSGVNVTGELPARPLHPGSELSVLSAAGLLGDLRFVPRYLGGKAAQVAIIGFPWYEGKVANLSQRAPPQIMSGGRRRNVPTVVVAGTSAESGKTTAMCALIRSARRMGVAPTIAATKATGTGRLRDRRQYAAAGADIARDFVDLGHVSTYNLSTARFLGMLDRLLDVPAQTALLLLELGGDLLEAHVPEALAATAGQGQPVVLCVNDALGAGAALRMLADLGAGAPVVASLQTNQQALAARLGLREVLDPGEPAHADRMLARVLDAGKAPGPACGRDGGSTRRRTYGKGAAR
jgi:hypothetical protein